MRGKTPFHIHWVVKQSQVYRPQTCGRKGCQFRLITGNVPGKSTGRSHPLRSKGSVKGESRDPRTRLIDWGDSESYGSKLYLFMLEESAPLQSNVHHHVGLYPDPLTDLAQSGEKGRIIKVLTWWCP